MLAELAFCCQQLLCKVSEMPEQAHVSLQIVVKSLDIHIPVQVYDPISQGDHVSHRAGEIRLQVPGLGQKTEQITLLLWTAQVVYRHDMAGDVGATLNRCLKRALCCQLGGKVILELGQAELLKLL